MFYWINILSYNLLALRHLTLNPCYTIISRLICESSYIEVWVSLKFAHFNVYRIESATLSSKKFSTKTAYIHSFSAQRNNVTLTKLMRHCLLFVLPSGTSTELRWYTRVLLVPSATVRQMLSFRVTVVRIWRPSAIRRKTSFGNLRRILRSVNVGATIASFASIFWEVKDISIRTMIRCFWGELWRNSIDLNTGVVCSLWLMTSHMKVCPFSWQAFFQSAHLCNWILAVSYDLYIC